jgi:hypothetical protein
MRLVGVPISVVCGAMLCACSGGADAPPVGPVVLTCPTANVSLCTDATGAVNVRAALTDAVTRLRPSLSTTANGVVTTELSALKAAVDAGSISAARASAERLRTSIATLRGNAALTPDLVTLDAITLAIITAQVALGVTPTQLTIGSADVSATPSH